MGNAETSNCCVSKYEEQTQELDFSRHVNHLQYTKHNLGVYSEKCLTSLPTTVVDGVYLHKILKLSFNCLSSVPDDLPLHLPHLTLLDISHNQLLTVPDSLVLFLHLNTLLLQHNCIECVPQSLVNLDRLVKLDLSYNNLHELPEDIGCMKALVKLNVSHNKIRKLPCSLGESRTIQLLIANKNFGCKIPPQDKCCFDSKETLAYLKKLSVSVEPEVNGARSNGSLTFPRVRDNILHLNTSTHAEQARLQAAQRQTRTSEPISRIRTPLMPPSNSTIYSPKKLSDKILGLIYGAAIGDALGLLTDDMTKDECEFYYDIDSLDCDSMLQDTHRVKWKNGDWTTNFDQLILVLESLIQWAGMVDELEFARRYHHWYNHGFPDLGDTVGIPVSEYVTEVVEASNFLNDPHGCSKSVYTSNLHQAQSNHTANNTSLVQCLILGVIEFHKLDEVVRNVERICMCTHYDPRCLASAVTLTVIVAKILQGAPLLSKELIDQWLTVAMTYGFKYLTSEEDKAELRKCLSVKSFDDINLHEEGKVQYVMKPVACAVAALHTLHRDYSCTLSQLIMLGGSASVNASVCGAILGVASGYSQLPTHWLTQLRGKQRDWLNHKLNLLLDMMALP